MARVHITTTEPDVLPSAVAAIAIIGAYLGARSTSHSQLRLAQGTHRRDRTTETYIDLLKGVYLRNAQIEDSYSRPMDQASRTPTRSGFDPTTEVEMLFAARLMAYASPEVDKLWGEFALLTIDFDNYMIALRNAAGVPPAEVEGIARQLLVARFDTWHQRRDELKDLIRRELDRG